MNETPLLSVIVPVYKVEKYLLRCVRSITAQTYQNLEIILVDDGSPDNCGRICEELASEDPRIHVIHKENGGLSSARNAGIDAAKGEYLGFVDSDDWIEPEAYAHMMELALRENALMVVGGRWDVEESTGEKTPGLCPARQETVPAEQMLGRLFVWDGCDSAAWDKLYSAELFAGIRYPEGAYYEDTPVTYRLMERAGRVALLNEKVYNYVHRANSITTARVSPKTFHMEQHSEKIYSDIWGKYPAIRSQVRFFKVRALRFSVLSLDLSDKETRKTYELQMKKSRRELRRHFFYILTAPWFPVQERIVDLLLSLNLYRPLRKLRHPEA